MHPIIFLDIDGVLQFYSQYRFKHDLTQLRIDLAEKFGVKEFLTYDKYDLGAVVYDWDKDSVANLKKLIETTGAKIVLSSDWRLTRSIEEMRLLMMIHDLHTYLIDYTPQIGYDRSSEVAQYLAEHPEITRFVILDDRDFDFSKNFPDNFVHTARDGKFLATHLAHALTILKADKV